MTKPQSRVKEYLLSRGLTDKSLTAYQVAEVPEVGPWKNWKKQQPWRGPWIVFPYLREKELVFTKYLHLERRDGKKQTVVESGCEPILYGMQVIPENQRFLAITEGEIDALSLFEYGMPAVSVPFGGGTGEKQAWIDCCYEWLERFSEIFLVMDADAEGQAAAKEIARRLGLHRCKVVTLPKKDANECLQAGIPKEEVLLCFQKAGTFDPEELKPAQAYIDGVINRFHPSGGQRPGIDLPWEKTKGRLRLYDGEVSIWTGINGHGKSLLLGQVMMGAAKQNAPCCIASMEMHPEKTLGRMVQQWTKIPNPSPDMIRTSMEILNGSVWIFDLTGTAKRERLLEVFRFAFHRYGVKQFVIDSLSKCGIGEDDYNGQKAFIDTLGDFAKSTGTHVHLVAHARKGGDEFSPPGKMDVKGTGALTDMVDNVLVVHRNKAKERDLAILDNGGSVRGKTRDDIQREYDAFMCCDKHREDGAEAEGMFGFYFDRKAQLFVERQP
ncbi:toprim domain-containing protein [Desulfuromonas sp. KJ2020]|uniref:bifunctional DNA primase/helicase n=1 Tax=Desulfuromonas sp. KJ2020 TaxID=2919173 RepID=UPI0020A77B36|nr:bifunctional DNA primase/helicase [Desulfuromonas sp. KJ2020]MCP3177440.1 toprim domain-containing protein [Desulfuromonas sp. KJ2020]